METKRDLVQIGEEAFELLDQVYPPNRRSSQTYYFHQYQSQKPIMVVYHQTSSSSKVATTEKMTVIQTHEIAKKAVPEAIEIRGSRPGVVPRSQYQPLWHNVYPKKHATIDEDKADNKRSRGGLFLIGGFGRK